MRKGGGAERVSAGWRQARQGKAPRIAHTSLLKKTEHI